MAAFPTDVVADILSRLPVKPLLRFRSVSKIWCALIDSDHFIKLHLHRSIDTKSHRKIVLPKRGFHFVCLDSLDVAEERDYPWASGKSPPLTVCCCNGLLLLWSYSDDSALWNPSTQKFHTISCPERNLSLLNSFNVGFGYDAVNDDYKVLSLTQLKHPQIFVSDVNVYSLKLDSWRTVKDFPYFIRRIQDGVLAHGALHWFLDKEDNDTHSGCSIVAFDLATEETRLVSLPEVGGGIDVSMNLMEFKGCLCIGAYLPRGYYGISKELLGVWVMKDYGVGESWNKLFSASQLSVLGSFYYQVFPLAYSKDGREVLLRDNEQFIRFDLENDAVTEIKVQGLPSYLEAMVFVQSLVRPGSGRETIPEEQRIQDKKIEMERLVCTIAERVSSVFEGHSSCF